MILDLLINLNQQLQIKKFKSYFFKLNHDLDLKSFETSDITVCKNEYDSYKIFEQHITNSTVRPENFNTLKINLI